MLSPGILLAITKPHVWGGHGGPWQGQKELLTFIGVSLI